MKKFLIFILLIRTSTLYAEYKAESRIVNKQIEYNDITENPVSEEVSFTILANDFPEKFLDKTSKFVAMDNTEKIVSYNIWKELKLWSSNFSSHSIYINYNMTINYNDMHCNIKYSDISYCETDNISANGKIINKDDVFTGEYILVDKKYRSLTKKNMNGIVIEKTEEHFNAMTQSLYDMLEAKR